MSTGRADSAVEGPDAVESPTPRDARLQGTRPAKGSPGVEMEGELLSALGAMLGTLEIMATDDLDPLGARQRDWLTEAVRHGHALKDQVEALLVLSLPHVVERIQPGRRALRRVVEHAVRGAVLGASERRVSVLLPPATGWGEVQVLADPPMVDWVLRGMTEGLVRAVGRNGSVRVGVSVDASSAHIELLGRAGTGHTPELGEQRRSLLLFAAWERVVRCHAGSFALDLAALRGALTLPVAETP